MKYTFDLEETTGLTYPDKSGPGQGDKMSNILCSKGLQIMIFTFYFLTSSANIIRIMSIDIALLL